jgi:class 3 adenylate cyclase
MEMWVATATSKPMICRGCWEQMRFPVPIRGPLAVPLRLFGIKRSNMNPDICTICELMFETVMRRRNVELDLTILFADLRGYTALAQGLDRDGIREILDFFYDECAAAIWDEDGLLNKTLGDGVMAIFNFPLAHPDHSRRAVRAARDIQRRCSEKCKPMVARLGIGPLDMGVGIGIHAGLTAFGEFGRAHRDLTAVGSVVNLAARLQSTAAAGEIVVTREVLERMGDERDFRSVRDCVLKGFAEPVTGYLL